MACPWVGILILVRSPVCFPMIAARLAVKKYALASARGRFFHRQPSLFRAALRDHSEKQLSLLQENEDDFILKVPGLCILLQTVMRGIR